jgi:hypothetical protein
MSRDNERGAAAAVGIIIVVVILLAIGGGVYLGSQGSGPLAGFFKSDAERVKDAFVKSSEEETADIEITASVQSESEGSFDVTWVAQGVPLKPEGDESDPVSQGTVTISGEVEGEDIDADIEYRAIPPRTYFRLSDLAIPDMGSSANVMLDTWMYFETSDEGQEMMADFMPMALPETCKENPEAATAYLKTVEPDTVFTSVARGESDQIGGETAVWYNIEINREGLEAAIVGMQEAAGCPDAEEVLEDEAEIEGAAIAVGSASGLVRGVRATIRPEADSEDTVQFTVRVTDYGNTPTVEEPEDAKSFEEVITMMLFGGMMLEGSDALDGSMMFEGGAELEVPDTGYTPPTDEELDQMMEELEQMQQEFEMMQP